MDMRKGTKIYILLNLRCGNLEIHPYLVGLTFSIYKFCWMSEFWLIFLSELLSIPTIIWVFNILVKYYRAYTNNTLPDTKLSVKP
jgi:hypothetical protein